MATVNRPRVVATRAFQAQHVRNALSEAILTGEYGSDSLPDEAALAAEFGVSRNVVREALDELRKQGAVVRIAGSGTFALPPKVEQPFDSLQGLQEILGDHLVYEAVDLRVVPATRGIAQTLRITTGDPVYHIERLGTVDGVRVVVTSTYIPVELFPELDRDGVRSLRHDLEAAGMGPHTAHLQISAVAADAAVALMLGVAVGTPLLFFRRVMHREDGVPLELCYTHYRSTVITLVGHQERSTRKAPQ